MLFSTTGAYCFFISFMVACIVFWNHLYETDMLDSLRVVLYGDLPLMLVEHFVGVAQTQIENPELGFHAHVLRFFHEDEELVESGNFQLLCRLQNKVPEAQVVIVSETQFFHSSRYIFKRKVDRHGCPVFQIHTTGRGTHRRKCPASAFLRACLYKARSEERRVGKECRSRW